MTPLFRLFLMALLAGPLASCSDEGSEPVVVSVLGKADDLSEPLRNLPDPGAKLMLEATAQGLVAFDAAGDILPALAQRWIVEDDGRSYIFRLRRAHWPDGTKVSSKEVARLLDARIKAIRTLDPDGALDAVEAVVPMTGEVIEIKMSAPRPFLLQMLAQPQMAILSRDGGTGPYREQVRNKTRFLSPVEDPTDSAEDKIPVPPWQNRVLRAERPSLAIARFQAGASSLVLGGRFADLPLLVAAAVDKNDVHIDPVQGLLGLAVTGKGPLLDDDNVREAINMAIDRDQLPTIFPLGGWATSNQLVPQQLDLPRQPAAPRWAGLSMDERRAQARATISRWRATHGDPPTLRIALPPGTGSRMLFAVIKANLRVIGLPAMLLDKSTGDADIRLIDEVAAYDSALWYVGRIGCPRKIHCSAQAEAKLREASLASNMAKRGERMAEAEALALAHNGYIPLGAPVRWSLVSRRLSGFTPSPRARHPLNHLFRSTN